MLHLKEESLVLWETSVLLLQAFSGLHEAPSLIRESNLCYARSTNLNVHHTEKYLQDNI